MEKNKFQDCRDLKNSQNMKNSQDKDQYSNSSTHSNYDNVEPLPESSRPRQDGPGGN